MEDESVAGGESAPEDVAVETVAAEVAPESSVEEVVAEAAPAVVVAAVPRFSREGVLLNPDDCEISPEGIVRPKAV